MKVKACSLPEGGADILPRPPLNDKPPEWVCFPLSVLAESGCSQGQTGRSVLVPTGLAGLAG